MLAAMVTAITMVVLPLQAQDTTAHTDTVPAVPPAPTIEQIQYMDGLKTVTRGVAQLHDALNRVSRTQQADSATRHRAAKRLGGLCGTARSFIASGRPKMKPTAYSDSLRILAKQLTLRLDTLTNALPICERTAGRDPSVATALTTKLKSYDDALLAFKTSQAALYRPDSAKAQPQTPQ
jgi:hypothetical protein